MTGPKYEVHGAQWKVSPIFPSVIDHLPGARIGADSRTVSCSRDAAAVLFRRLETSNPDTKKLDIRPLLADALGEKLEAAARTYQKNGIIQLKAQLELDGGAVLADDMGLGKTLQTLGTWDALKRPYPLLVVAPASVRRTWVREVQKWAPDITPYLADTGAKAAKVTNDMRIVITSYELATSKLHPHFAPHMMIMDEAHLLRGRMSKRSQGLLELGQVARYKLALTGTPLWSRPRDWWMLLKILFGYRFGTADQFDFAYCGARINQWGGKENTGATRIDELKIRIDHIMLRRLKEDVAAELPPMTRVVRWVKPTKEVTLASTQAALGNLSVYDALSATLAGKIDAAVEAMLDAGKSLCFTWRKADAQRIAELAEEAGLKVELITGDQSHAERQVRVDRAQKLGHSVVATIDSTGAGVDGLQHVASVGIFHALDYVPIKMAQAEARLHRTGAVSPVTWVYIAMENSADQHVISMVVEKLDQWRALMGADTTSTLAGPLSVQTSEEDALKAIVEAMREDQ